MTVFGRIPHPSHGVFSKVCNYLITKLQHGHEDFIKSAMPPNLCLK